MQALFHYCTYFDSRYLARGLTMIRSLRRVQPESKFWVLCLDAGVKSYFDALNDPGMVGVTLEDLQADFPSLEACRKDRSLVEFYFTCTPMIVRYVLFRVPEQAWVTYADGDMWFLSSPRRIYERIDEASVFIVPHAFSAGNEGLKRYGRYNVGWVSFRNDEQGNACAAWWGDRCQDWCRDYFDNGRFADQAYLDSFPQLFTRVVENDDPGVNLAPWNLASYSLSYQDQKFLVDGVEVIFFHFHKLKKLNGDRFLTCHRSYGAEFNELMKQRLYRPYIKEVMRIEKELEPFLRSQPVKPLQRENGRLRLSGWWKKTALQLQSIYLWHTGYGLKV